MSISMWILEKHTYVHMFSLLQYLEEEYRKGAREDDPMPPVQPYHYGSHYSNSGTVLHFLVRMPPFTKMFLAYQGKNCFRFSYIHLIHHLYGSCLYLSLFR